MYDNRDASPTFLQQKRDLFYETVNCIWDSIFSGETPTKLSVTVEEALLVGVSKNIKALATESAAVLRARYKKLITNHEFSDTALREGLSKKPRVIARLAAAIDIFAGN
jgi:hypothetical protein